MSWLQACVLFFLISRTKAITDIFYENEIKQNEILQLSAHLFYTIWSSISELSSQSILFLLKYASPLYFPCILYSCSLYFYQSVPNLIRTHQNRYYYYAHPPLLNSTATKMHGLRSYLTIIILRVYNNS